MRPTLTNETLQGAMIHSIGMELVRPTLTTETMQGTMIDSIGMLLPWSLWI